MRTPSQPAVGTVDVWHDADGWGVLRTRDGLSVFCHYSQVEMQGHQTLEPGALVWFDYETPGQDGCDARVRTAARPGTPDPAKPLGTLLPATTDAPGINQRLTVTFTDPAGHEETVHGHDALRRLGLLHDPESGDGS